MDVLKWTQGVVLETSSPPVPHQMTRLVLDRLGAITFPLIANPAVVILS